MAASQLCVINPSNLQLFQDAIKNKLRDRGIPEKPLTVMQEEFVPTAKVIFSDTVLSMCTFHTSCRTKCQNIRCVVQSSVIQHRALFVDMRTHRAFGKANDMPKEGFPHAHCLKTRTQTHARARTQTQNSKLLKLKLG